MCGVVTVVTQTHTHTADGDEVTQTHTHTADGDEVTQTHTHTADSDEASLRFTVLRHLKSAWV
jgi:hypothetical protein